MDYSQIGKIINFKQFDNSMMTLSFRYSIVWLVFFVVVIFVPRFFKEEISILSNHMMIILFYFIYFLLFFFIVIKLINSLTLMISGFDGQEKNSLNNLYIRTYYSQTIIISKWTMLKKKEIKKNWMNELISFIYDFCSLVFCFAIVSDKIVS